MGTSNTRPESLAVKVQLGPPKLQLVALGGVGVRPEADTPTLPAVVWCMATASVDEPAGMLKAAPAGQFTVMPVPLAASVPVTPPV